MNASALRIRLVHCAFWAAALLSPCAADEAGRPDLDVHAPSSFGGGPISRTVMPLADGRIAVANSEGLAIFDGARWRLNPHPLDSSGLLGMTPTPAGEFCGGFPGEIGCFAPRPDGSYVWRSLNARLPTAMRNFNKVAAATYDEVRAGVWFAMQSQLVFVPDKADAPPVMLEVQGNGWFPHENTLLLYASGRGIFRISREGTPALEQLAPIEDVEGKILAGFHDLGDGRLLTLQLGGRASLIENGRARRIWADGEDQRRTMLPSAFRAISGGRYAIGFQRGPLTIVDADGQVLQRLGAEAGVREIAIADIREDREGGLWITQINGITRIDQSSATTFYGPEFGSASVSSLYRWQGRVFITSQFRMLALDTDAEPARFTPHAPALPHQLGMVVARGERLFAMGDAFYVFENPGQAPRRLDASGHLSTSRLHPDRLYTLIKGAAAQVVSTAQGIQVQPLPQPLHAFTDVVEHRDALWLYRENGQLSRMRMGPDGWLPPEAVLDSGLPQGQFFLAGGRDELWAATREGMYRLRGDGTRFERADDLPDPFREGPIHTFLEDGQGHLWLQSRQHLGVAWREADGWRWDPAPLAALDPQVRILHIAREGDLLWLLKADGLARIDLARQRRDLPLSTPVLSEIRDQRSNRLLPLQGWRGESSARVRVEFGLPAMQRREGNLLRHRLAGFSETFSPWSTRSSFEFADLRPGEYAFEVEARDALGRVSRAQLLAFAIPTPWYQQPWATAGFVLLALAALHAAARYGARHRQRQMIARQQQLEGIVAERTAELAQSNARLAEQAERLQTVDRLKTRFFVNVGHEFRTPLTLVLGPVDDLLRDGREHLSERVRGQLQLVQRNARRVLDLIVELLDVNRLEQGQLRLHTAVHDLAPLLERVARENAPLVERFGQTLELVLPSGAAAPCRLDPLQIERALGNLIGNAAKYSPRGTVIELGLHRDEAVHVLWVRDQGRGIGPDALPHVFDRFFQTDGSATASGYGIGLSLVREIALAHGGEVEARSTLGVGSTFELRLPASTDVSLEAAGVRDDAHAIAAAAMTTSDDDRPDVSAALPVDAAHRQIDAAAEGPDLASAAQRERERVLVVDDHEDLRQRVRELLGHRFDVIEAADGNLAWQRARDELPDLVVSDVMMPGCDGVELTRRLRSHPDTHAIGILLLTAKVGSDHAVAGLAAGANDYLAKPFDASELLARCEAIVAHARRLQHRLAAAAAAAPLGRVESQGDRWRQRLDQHIAAHLHDPAFGIEALARCMHGDRTQLFRKCKELLGQSPSDYLRDTRLAHGHRLLEQSAGNVSEVAYACGFDSLSSFTRAFKTRYGIPPSQVRGNAA